MSSVADASLSLPDRQRLPPLRALLADPFTCVALILVTGFLITAIFAPWLAPYSPIKIDVLHKLQPPSLAHWFGTDHLGRDLLSRVIFGARTALTIAMVSVAIAGAIGLLLGLIAGYGPRWLDAILVLSFDSLNSLPMIMFALAIITVLGAGTGTLIIVIAATSFPSYARLIRAQTLALKNSDYILAERLLDASATRIIFIHLLPNVVGPLIILLSMDIPVVIMVEAGLSFLGLGVRPPTPSWGSILYDGYTSIRSAPFMVIFGGLPLVLATLGFTFLGEGLRDYLDPRLQLRRPA
ncbi:ABC transporter permease [Mesorhizobium sp. M7D.F.Ca.US.004.01.2.1]|uniref:ABC transporter permease n=1 Tax=Mesorhizobium sp. M7D.F.Ca.US.004.01.2.1 TaxID=2496738 RepID=UPI000FCA744B|nr:ABC transporter permease [Mesorhizobium sp. M7D.F.Ca.US.004.01.2.1]RUX97384.1 ABC transporter permease [Mesorhizobium sp. M7D.F.Ca.US.004.01.2.1]RVA25862.1 ABC transporter permease [Mesorhizobium sp. M7D.F.Ca.US.004.03.1.1]